MDWHRPDRLLPEPQKAVLVVTQDSRGRRSHGVAYHIPRWYLNADDCDPGELECDYDEARDQYYWPEGWFEPTLLAEADEPLDWAIHDEVLAWAPLPKWDGVCVVEGA